MARFRITKAERESLVALLEDAALCGAGPELAAFVISSGYGKRLAGDLARHARRCRDAALRNAGGAISLTPERRREALRVIELGRAAMVRPAPRTAA